MPYCRKNRTCENQLFDGLQICINARTLRQREVRLKSSVMVEKEVEHLQVIGREIFSKRANQANIRRGWRGECGGKSG